MPILELCAGYGGLGLAVEALTGERLHYVAEVDPHAAKILAARFPQAVNLGDVTAIDWASLIGEVNVTTAGFPCQGISNAGKRKGLADERSAIWFDVLKSIRTIRPELVCLENVAAIRRRGLPEVLGGLAEAGYDSRWISIRATEVGAAHARERWFCAAVPRTLGADPWARWRHAVEGLGQGAASAGAGQLSGAARGAGEADLRLPDSGGVRRDWRTRLLEESTGWPQPQDPGHSPAAWWGDYLPAVRQWEDLTGRAAPPPTERGPRGGVRLAATWAEWLMGLPAGWVTGVDGLKRADQLRAIGNGVMPQQAIEALRRLLA
ncbi:DNA cytosine methyltransferase [Streptomyces nojiriensis]|uniref:DNA cytosine methyltransferase n=1 Tax=Streptomyces nojiriensis TaxID=66374 RepID=UPI0036DCCDAA